MVGVVSTVVVSSGDEVVVWVLGVTVSVVVVAPAVGCWWVDTGVGVVGELEQPPKTATKLIKAQEV